MLTQAKYNGDLYVIEKTPYQITEDTDANIIYVPMDSVDGYRELNENLPIVGYGYSTIKVNRLPFMDALETIVTTESNAPLMAVLYAKGLAANENYMTLAEAKAVTNEQLDGLLNGNNTVVSFNEFKYFTGITKIGTSDDAEGSKTTAPFRQCTSLKYITLPPTVKELGARAFDLCRNVDRINGLENVTKFNYCSLQATFALDSSMNVNTLNVEKLGGKLCINNVYSSEYTIKNIVIKDSVTEIPEGAFYKCFHTENITIPNTVTSIGVTTNNSSGAFVGCKVLKRLNSDIDGIINIPSGVTSIGNQAFYIGKDDYNTNITEINISDSVTTISNSALAHYINCNTLNIGSGITNIGTKALNYVGTNVDKFTMTCKALTPPTWDGLLNNVEDITIYVPSESVNLYKEASGFSNYADHIKPIE